MAAGCQWIVGDPRAARSPGADDLKCGEPVASIGLSYCEAHMARAYLSGGEAKTAVWAMTRVAARGGVGRARGS